jgi:hypothetical protein
VSPPAKPRQGNIAFILISIFIEPMASIAPQPPPWRSLLEPMRGAPLIIGAVVVWLAGASYCHGYQLLSRGWVGPWSGSLSWSAVAVVPWFGLFEWSKQPRRLTRMEGTALLAGLILGIAALSIALEYLVNFCAGEVTDHLSLLMMRRVPAIAGTALLIGLARKSLKETREQPTCAELSSIADMIDWVAAADNYVELHIRGRPTLRRMTMTQAAGALERHGFVRIHRRYLINRARIAEVRDRCVKLTNGEELPVGSAFAANLRH